MGSCGPVSNVLLCVQLLTHFNKENRIVHWVKVPSQKVSIAFNDEVVGVFVLSN